MASPRHSVVIPAYNGRATIGETVASVLAQTEAGLELIVVDDGSTDDTVSVVRAFAGDSRLRLIEQPNQGTAGARNTGIAAAGGEFVAFLDNDDLWMPDYLERSAAALDGDPSAGFSYCDAWGFDDGSRRFMRRTELESRPGPPAGATPEEALARLIRVNFVMSSVCARRAVLDEVDGFDTSVRGTDDYDLWLRIMLAGHGAVRAGERPLLIQRDRYDSQSADEAMMDRNLRLALERVVADPRAPEGIAAAARERIREIDQALERMERPGPRERLLDAARRTRNAINPGRVWLDEAPADVAAAFPDLARR